MIENMNNSKIKSKVNTIKEREIGEFMYIVQLFQHWRMLAQNNMYHNWEQNRESTHLSL